MDPHASATCPQSRQLAIEGRIEVVELERVRSRLIGDHMIHIVENRDRTPDCARDDCRKRCRSFLNSDTRFCPECEARASVELPGETAFDVFTDVDREVRKAATYLPVVPVTLKANDRRYLTWALLDQGSEITVIRADLARRLGLTGSAISLNVGTLLNRVTNLWGKK